MLIKALDAISGDDVFSCGVDGVMPIPSAGDILVDPQFKQFRVLQRAYIVREVNPPGKVLDLTAPKTIDVEIQCAVCPVGQEQEYAERMTN